MSPSAISLEPVLASKHTVGTTAWLSLLGAGIGDTEAGMLLEFLGPVMYALDWNNPFKLFSADETFFIAFSKRS